MSWNGGVPRSQLASQVGLFPYTAQSGRALRRWDPETESFGKDFPTKANRGEASSHYILSRRADGNSQITKSDTPFLVDTQHLHTWVETAVPDQRS